MTNLLARPQIVRLFEREGTTARKARIGSALALCEAPAIRNDGEVCADFDAVGDRDLETAVWGPSVGGLMIRSLRSHKGTGGIRDETRLKDPQFNVHSAVVIMRAQGWKPWSTFTSGQFKAYLPGLYPPPPGVHVVVYGDTLGEIATRHDLAWQELARINGLHTPYRIYIGQNLRLEGLA